MFGSSLKQAFISTGNDTFDTFFGGGLLNSTLNIFERQGLASRPLETIVEKSISASTLANKCDLIYVNFNSELDIKEDLFLESLPLPKKVKPELLYKDVRPKSASAMIKIAWRYTAQGSSPSTGSFKENQNDFGLCLSKHTDIELTNLHIINIKNETFSFKTLIDQLASMTSNLANSKSVNIILANLLHPFSPIYGDPQKLLFLLYAMRAFARTIERGMVMTVYDTEMCQNHSSIKNLIYNTADAVVSFYTFADSQSRLLGYKDTDGTVDYIKVPKLNTFSHHFQRELSDWGYRTTKNNKYFVIDKLSLPPCDSGAQEDRTTIEKKDGTELLGVHKHEILEEVGPLEEFKDFVGDVLRKNK